MTATTLATALARRIEQDGHITDMVNLHAGPKRYFKKRQRKYTTGNESAYFAMRLGGSGAKGTYTAGGTLVGASGTALAASPTYKNIKTRVVKRMGYLSVSGDILPDVLGGKDRNMLQQFNEELMSHFEMWANDWNITFFTGASEALFRIADTPNPVNVTGNQWRVYVDTTKDARYMQNAYTIKPGHFVQVAVESTHALLSDSGGTTLPYRGIIRSIAEDGLSVIIEWESARTNVASDLTSSHFVRFDTTTAADMGKYGLYDFVGNTTSAYVDEGGTGTNAFPYHTDETSLDPDTQGEWSSIIFEQAGSTFSVNDFDTANEKIKKRLGHNNLKDYVCFGSPEIETQLIQENRIQRRWQAGAKSMDQTPDGRMVTDADMTFEVDTHCPEQHAYFIDTSVLANDELDDRGPSFDNAPNQSGSRTQQLFTQDRTTDEYFAHTRWYGQRMTLQRNRHVLAKPNSGGS